MPNYIATYDLKKTNPEPYGAFLEAAESLGWNTWIKSDGGEWYRLPNTTLEGEFKDIDAATHAFHAIKPSAEASLGRTITVEKFIVAQYSTAKFNSDETQRVD